MPNTHKEVGIDISTMEAVRSLFGNTADAWALECFANWIDITVNHEKIFYALPKSLDELPEDIIFPKILRDAENQDLILPGTDQLSADQVHLTGVQGQLHHLSGLRPVSYGAGDGNRTHVRSLGSFYTAIVRRPLIISDCTCELPEGPGVRLTHGVKREVVKEKAKGRLARRANAEELADFCIATIQGGMLMGKIKRDSRPVEIAVREGMTHLRRFAVSPGR